MLNKAQWIRIFSRLIQERRGMSRKRGDALAQEVWQSAGHLDPIDAFAMLCQLWDARVEKQRSLH
jgi:hypothetical protein